MHGHLIRGILVFLVGCLVTGVNGRAEQVLRGFFFSREDGHIYRSDASGQNATRIVENANPRRIEVDSERGRLYWTTLDQGTFEIWQTTVSGENPRLLANAGNMTGAISVNPSDGALFYIKADATSQNRIFRIDPETQIETELPLNAPNGWFLHVVGNEILDPFDNIEIANLDHSQPTWTSIAFPFAEMITGVSVDPDTGDIIFGYTTTEMSFGVGRYDRTTQETRQVTFPSLDGLSIIYPLLGTDTGYVVEGGDVLELDLLTGQYGPRTFLAADRVGFAIDVGESTQDPIDSEAPVGPLILEGPAMSGAFGTEVFALPNGNLVVTDPEYDDGAGAVYLYSPALVQISRLAGAVAGDRVGSGGVTVLPSGNFVVVSPEWNDEAGAVTWASMIDGVGGMISSTNSLVGSTSFDLVGSGGLTVLPNGNYIVSSAAWAGRGAVTFGNGATGISGPVSAENSLIGSTFFDQVGSGGITILANGNYVVASPKWDRAGIIDAGAVTWGHADTGVSGTVSPNNSVVGSTSFDYVSGHAANGVVPLTNGNYVVESPLWDHGEMVDTGAATWCDGNVGRVGELSSSNSMVGSSALDRVGREGVTALANGHYVILSTSWNAGAGAATWGDGAMGSHGLVSMENSLVGQTADKAVGARGVLPLTNGNYVVLSSERNAATWANGAIGLSGTVNESNSLLGWGGYRVSSAMALPNGNYLVQTGTLLTFGDGDQGFSGLVNLLNSLYPPGEITPLSDGNLVLNNHFGHIWMSGEAVRTGSLPSSDYFRYPYPNRDVYPLVPLLNGHYLMVGSESVTWAGGGRNRPGAVSADNSLVSNWPENEIASGGVTVLTNGDYVVVSPTWGVWPETDEGAVTWGSGTEEIRGAIRRDNSLTGDSPGDQVGSGGVYALPHGRYAIHSPYWDHIVRADVGAMTLIDPNATTSGTVASQNSFLGTVTGGGHSMPHAYDERFHRLVVGYPAGNTVGVLSFPYQVAVEREGRLILGQDIGDFGSAPSGGLRELTYVIRNDSLVGLTGITAFIDDDDFTITSPPSATIESNQGMRFTVEFSPSTIGAKAATLQIRYENPNEDALEIVLEGEAVANWSLDRWRGNHFEPAELSDASTSGPNRDPEGDGWTNLLEYVLRGDPMSVAGSEPLFLGYTQDRLKLSFVRERAATDVDLVVEAADTPAGPWETAATSLGGGAFVAANGFLVEVDDSAGRVVIADKLVLSNPSGVRRFMRLSATLQE